MTDDARRKKALTILDTLRWVGDADVWVRFPSGREKGPMKVAEASYLLAGDDAATVHALPLSGGD